MPEKPKPGRAGKLNPRGPNKFEPTTKADPNRPDGPDHGAPGEQTNKQKKGN